MPDRSDGRRHATRSTPKISSRCSPYADPGGRCRPVGPCLARIRRNRDAACQHPFSVANDASVQQRHRAADGIGNRTPAGAGHRAAPRAGHGSASGLRNLLPERLRPGEAPSLSLLPVRRWSLCEPATESGSTVRTFGEPSSASAAATRFRAPSGDAEAFCRKAQRSGIGHDPACGRAWRSGGVRRHGALTRLQRQ